MQQRHDSRGGRRLPSQAPTSGTCKLRHQPNSLLSLVQVSNVEVRQSKAKVPLVVSALLLELSLLLTAATHSKDHDQPTHAASQPQVPGARRGRC